MSKLELGLLEIVTRDDFAGFKSIFFSVSAKDDLFKTVRSDVK